MLVKESVRTLLTDTANRASDYLEQLDDMPVLPTEDLRVKVLDFDGPFPDEGMPAEEVIDELDRIGSKVAVASAGPRFFGFVVGGTLPAALAADWLTSTWDQCNYAPVISPLGIELELVAVNWIRELIGLPQSSRGVFVTGATMASFACLAAARHHLLEKLGWDVEEHGIWGAPRLTLVVSDQAHSSVGKSLAMLGLGRGDVIRVPTDDNGAMIADEVPVVDGPAIYCVQVGNVDSGSIDPIAEICGRIRRATSWVHVDGAFGLWASVSPKYQHLLHGHHLADSWAVDAHKWLNVPYDSGVAFVRDPETLFRTFSTSASYLMDDRQKHIMSFLAPQLSRRARSIAVYAALRSLGRKGVIELVENCCRLAKLFADQLSDRGHTILNDVVLNQVLVKLNPERRDQIQEAIDTCAVFWTSNTNWRGDVALRLSLCNWKTTEEDIHRSVAKLDEILTANGC